MVLGDNDRCSELLVDPQQHIEKPPPRHRIELRHRLVKQNHFRAHNEHRSQVQQLLLTAGELRCFGMQNICHTKIHHCFSNARMHLIKRNPFVFQTERKLADDHIGADLGIRVLHHKTNTTGLFNLGQ